MIARRLTALLLAVFMLHLNFLGADVACSEHGDESASAATALPASHDMNAARSAHQHGPSHGATQLVSLSDASSEAPCEIPAQSNCCQAFMGCSIVFSPNTNVTVASSLTSREMFVRGALNAPRSERAAPEPPPPRA